MWLIDALAERRIRDAQRAGEFDRLRGAGQRLVFDDDRFVPEALRAGYRLLRNAGFLPPELSLRREIATAEALLAQTRDGSERECIGRRLNALRAALQARGRDLRLEGAYFESLRRHLEPHAGPQLQEARHGNAAASQGHRCETEDHG